MVAGKTDNDISFSNKFVEYVGDKKYQVFFEYSLKFFEI